MCNWSYSTFHVVVMADDDDVPMLYSEGAPFAIRSLMFWLRIRVQEVVF